MIAVFFLGVVLSMAIIWKACDYFDVAANFLGRNLSDGVKGATYKAIGSSLPELFATSVALLFYANTDGFSFGIGTTAGSAMFNSAVIPGLVVQVVIFSGLATVVTVSRKVILRDGLFLIGAELLLIYLVSKGYLDWTHGFILVGFYVIYILVMFKTMNGNVKSKKDEDFEGMTTAKAWITLAVTVLCISVACYVLVEACYVVGEAFDIRIYFIAVILPAVITSIPDTIISVKDALTGNSDDGFANALGSNIFDICVCLGLPLAVYSLFTGNAIEIAVADTGSVAELRVILLIITVILFFIFLTKNLGKVKGFLMLGLYGVFVVYVVARALDNPFAASLGNQLQQFLKIIGG